MAMAMSIQAIQAMLAATVTMETTETMDLMALAPATRARDLNLATATPATLETRAKTLTALAPATLDTMAKALTATMVTVHTATAQNRASPALLKRAMNQSVAI